MVASVTGSRLLSPAVSLRSGGCFPTRHLESPKRPSSFRPLPLAIQSITTRASSSPTSTSSSASSPQGSYRGPVPRRNLLADWVSNNDGVARSLPIYVGAAALLAVLLNRALSGIAPVADASSSQSRADILCIALAVTDILAGLVWLSIKPKNVSPVRVSLYLRILMNMSHYYLLGLYNMRFDLRKFLKVWSADRFILAYLI